MKTAKKVKVTIYSNEFKCPVKMFTTTSDIAEAQGMQEIESFIPLTKAQKELSEKGLYFRVS